MYIFGRDKYFRPAFVFDGFRFVEYIEKYPGLVTPENIVRAFVFLWNYLKEVMFLDGHVDYFNYIAYMNNFQLHHSPHLTPSRLLMGFLDFYSNCFDPRLYGINTTNGK